MTAAQGPGKPTEHRPGLWMRGILQRDIDLLEAWMAACVAEATAAQDASYSILANGKPALVRLIRERCPELSARQRRKLNARLTYIMERSQWLARHPPRGTA